MAVLWIAFQEDRETRKMLQKDKRKKTKIIQNDEGEDVEVTDDEAVSCCLMRELSFPSSLGTRFSYRLLV